MAAASGGASLGSASDDAGQGGAAGGGPWAGRLGRAPGQGLQAPRVSRVGRVGPPGRAVGGGPQAVLQVWRATLTAKYQVIVAAESELRVGITPLNAIDWPNERSAHYSKPGR